MAPDREVGVGVVQLQRQVADRVGQVEADHGAQVLALALLHGSHPVICRGVAQRDRLVGALAGLAGGDGHEGRRQLAEHLAGGPARLLITRQKSAQATFALACAG